MDQREELTTTDLPLLEAWPDIPPDPEAMNQVTALMVAGVAAARTGTAEPGEPQFRLLTIICGVVILAGYLAWDFLYGWLSLHPVWLFILLVVGGLSLVSPLLLVPILLHVDRLERPAAD